MPTPDRTSLPEIVTAGIDLLEAAGLDKLTMQAVAERVGVRAPSLYKRVRSRDHLLALIAEQTLHDLTAKLDAATVRAGSDPRENLRAVARVFRAFARRRPNSYGLVFSQPMEVANPSEELLANSSRPVIDAVAALVGPADALEAARTVTAWATGFIFLELGGRFQLGGDVERAFDYGVDLLADALLASSSGHPVAR
ncbi:TetR/AcrR family transcriptional regulator [Leifsonia poae]|uniref:TetR/AcrR family transcriptional regulator n=1 Tax=Leifsonia poae TaxID=110933 RepID=UPI003D668ED5